MSAAALDKHHEVWTLTRGNRPLQIGVKSLVPDRQDHQLMESVIAGENTTWDLVGIGDNSQLHQ